VVRLLLDRGAKVEPRDDRGLSALEIARQAGHAETVEVLTRRAPGAQ
jgi:ankyrin repeat protein